MRALSDPHLSPDGRSVLMEVSDPTADGGRRHLWLVDLQANTARQLTYSVGAQKQGEFGGEWLPDGSAILFLAHRGQHTQLYELPMEGGEAHPFDIKLVPPVDESKQSGAIPPVKTAAAPAKVEPVECDVAGFFVEPQGGSIAVLIRDPQTLGEKKEQTEKADAVWVDHDPHGTRLYLLDPKTGKLTPTAVPPDVEDVVWTRRGDRLLAIVKGMNDLGDIAPDRSAWIVSVSDPAHPMPLKAIPKTIETGGWSADATRIDFLAQAQADTPPGYFDLYQYTLADRSVRDLSAGLNGSIGLGGPIADGDSILQPVQIGVDTTVLRFVAGHHIPVRFGIATVSQLSTNARRTGWVWIGSSSTQPPTLYFTASLGQPARAPSTPAVEPAAWTPVPSRVLTWKSGNLTIQGLLYLPPQASPDHKVPLIVNVHGGPTGAFVDRWSPFTEFLLGHGWAVLSTNPRGSTGYGAAFVAANRYDMGGGDLEDILAGVDAALANYPLDPNKMALMGYSYGGEMAGFMEGKTTRFKAIVAGAPVTDQESEYGTEDGSWYDRWFYGGFPWEHAADAWKQSALAYAAHAKTPLLLLQGEADRTDPLGQSEEMFRALRQMGVPVDLIEYPREDHGPLAIGIFGEPSPEPWHGFDGRQRIVNFFDKAFAQ
ncbi:MAG TPA: prolyl oligopeptidase family serine peptidase [Steroidobacteraceae bacterium]|nr:prolyl oligopeptidase family serine peptidase [Steroidobacteraceae bacterium]